MVEFEPTGLKSLLLKVIEGVIVEEQLDDQKITQQRRDVCSDCNYMDTENVVCTKCGCFLALKTKSKVNVNPKTLRSEITFCPLNKWFDHFSKLGYDNFKTKSEQSENRD